MTGSSLVLRLLRRARSSTACHWAAWRPGSGAVQRCKAITWPGMRCSAADVGSEDAVHDQPHQRRRGSGPLAASCNTHALYSSRVSRDPPPTQT